MDYIDSLRHWSGKDICDPPDFYKKEKGEPEIPAFMCENQYRRNAREWREHNEQAQIGAIVGTTKKQARETERVERSKKECVLFLVGAALLLLLVGAVG